MLFREVRDTGEGVGGCQQCDRDQLPSAGLVGGQDEPEAASGSDHVSVECRGSVVFVLGRVRADTG